MSTLWTPSGERPIPRRSDPEPSGQPPSTPPAGPAPPPRPWPDAGPETDPSEEEVRAELAAIAEEILSVPASVVVANHCVGLFQLAALHLDQQPPDLAEASVAIDALAGIVESLGSRLGHEGPALQDALNQLRLAFVAASR